MKKDLGPLLDDARKGSENALAELFAHYKDQLRRIVAFRLDSRLKGRVDPSDILQEAFIDLLKRLPEFPDKNMSFFVWLRLVTNERVLACHPQICRRELPSAMAARLRWLRKAEYGGMCGHMV